MQQIRKIYERIIQSPILCSPKVYWWVFICWACITFLVGVSHEPWGDEAQSWLIARDCSFKELFSVISHYEGTPALFFVLLKLLQWVHFPYEALFLIPFVCTGVGIYLFLFRSKLPPIIKVLFPFTFFPAYQYAVMGRNYVLIWPLLGLLAVLHARRFERPFWYAVVLLLLASSTAYGMVLAGVIFAYYVYGLMQAKHSNTSQRIACMIVIASMILTVLYTSKAADCTFPAFLKIPSVFALIQTWASGFTAQTAGIGFWVMCLLVLGFYGTALLLFCKNWVQRGFFIAINGALIVVLAMLYHLAWHSGYLILTVLFSIWVLLEENKTYATPHPWVKDIFYGCWTILAIIQMGWAVSAIAHEVSFRYSPGQVTAQFITEHKLTQHSIHGIGFRVIAVQPYFTQNIYQNFSKSFFWWKKSENLFQVQNVLQSDLLIWTGENLVANQSLLAELKEEYDFYEFSGNMPEPGGRRSPDYFVIMVRKGIL